jgi:hypothetical protein
MKILSPLSVISLCALACSKPIPPANATDSLSEVSTETAGIEGVWADNLQEVWRFNADGTVDNSTFKRATLNTAKTCTAAGFDVTACSQPRFLWRPHPQIADAFLFAVRVPLTSGSTENNDANCFCLPEPGLPMLAIQTDDSLEVSTVGPDGKPIPTSGYTLKRRAINP